MPTAKKATDEAAEVAAAPARKRPRTTSTTSEPTSAKRSSKKPAVLDLAVATGEDPWTVEEIDEIRAELVSDMERFRTMVEQAEADLLELLAEGNDGAGRDPADVGSNNFERDQEILITAKNREGFEQCERALERLDSGEYGTCESCAEPIGKGRLMAFPRATLCVSCKQREERR